MRARTYFFVASRLALSRKGANLMSAILIIALSLIPLVVVVLVSKGMTEGIIGRYLEVASYHLRATPLVYKPAQLRLESMMADIERLPGFSLATTEMENYAMAFTAAGRQGVQLRGVDPNFYAKDAGMRQYLSIIEGSAQLDLDHALIGRSLAKTLNLKVGDTLRLLSVDGESRVPFFRAFTVAGIVSVGYDQLDKSWVFLDHNSEEFFANNDSTQLFIGVKVSDPFSNIAKQKDDLQAILPQDWLITDWYASNYASIENLKMTTVLLIFVLGLIVCVAVTNTTGALQIFFLSRRKEIALLKAMGASPRHINKLFICLGFLTGLCGAILGVMIGTLLATQINGIIWLLEMGQNLWGALFHSRGFSSIGGESFYLEKTKVHVNLSLLISIIIAVACWSALVNWAPARKIGKTKVLTILRKI